MFIRSSGAANRAITVTAIQRRAVEDSVEVSAQVAGISENPADTRLWFRFPRRFAEGITADGDAYLAALLPAAVRRRKPLEIDGPVSTQLLAGCQQIMRIWNDWNPKNRPIRVVPKECAPSAHAGAGVAAFFSLGVDSFYTLLKNLQLEKGDGRISHLITVHGFDIGLGNSALFGAVAQNVREVADSLSIEAVLVATNIRTCIDESVAPWARYLHGPAMAGVGLCLNGLLRRVLIPASNTYADPFLWASHPLVDPLWSTESLQFCHDGAEASRIQKILWRVARSELALEYLRVCWENPDNRYNCSRCEKCLRTMVALQAAGALDRCKTLEHAIDLRRLREVPVDRLYLEENLEALDRQGGNEEIRRTLRGILAGKGLWPRMRWALRTADRRCLGGALYRLYQQYRD